MLLYETLSQPLIFLIVFCTGFASGLLVDFRHYIYFLCNKNKFVSVFLDIVVTLLCCLIFFGLVLNFNFGEMRVYLVIAFLSGLLAERFTLGLVVAKIANWCYNNFRKLISKFAYEKTNDKKKSVVDN